ncbi:hypothetical protein V866_001154 [Kwoniella sp. B9012]
MSPAFLRDVNEYVAYEGYNWNPSQRDPERLPQASEVLYERDPWVKKYRETMLDRKFLWGNTPSAFRGQLQPSELLAEGEDLLVNKNIQSVADKSRARACTVYGGSDPGPTVAEHMRSQDPPEYALSVIRKEYDEDELDAYDPEAYEPFLPHSALTALRERQSTIA